MSPTKLYLVTQIILQMWPCDQRLMTQHFYERSYHDLNVLKIWLEKPLFLGGGWSWFKFNNLVLSLGITLKFYTSVAKNLKLKVLGTNFYVCRSYRGKTGSCSYVVPHHTPSRKGLSKFLSIKESLTESLT